MEACECEANKAGLEVARMAASFLVKKLLALRVPCCVLWVDVEAPLLAEYLDRRVDDMVCSGMVEELREYFAATTPAERAAHAAGLGKAIGVPELGESSPRSKIRRMEDGWGWPVRRLDASATVRARIAGAGPAASWCAA